MLENNFRIELADTRGKYEGLRTLWCEVFDDDPDFVDAMFETFGAEPASGAYSSDDICGYVVTVNSKDADHCACEIASALTCFFCGTYKGIPVYTSYAICTDPRYRGLGLAGRLVEQARDDVRAKGGISLISPAEPSLEKFYGAHGYIPFFFADKKSTYGESDEEFIFNEEDDEYDKVVPKIELRPLDAVAYNEYRERFLEDIAHVSLNEQMMRLVQAESMMPDGGSGLILINDGDAICTLGIAGAGSEIETKSKNGTQESMIAIEEILVNPSLTAISSEISEEIATRIAGHFGLKSIDYRTPGGTHCQSMIAGLSAHDIEENIKKGAPAYYGFPIEE